MRFRAQGCPRPAACPPPGQPPQLQATFITSCTALARPWISPGSAPSNAEVCLAGLTEMVRGSGQLGDVKGLGDRVCVCVLGGTALTVRWESSAGSLEPLPCCPERPLRAPHSAQVVSRRRQPRTEQMRETRLREAQLPAQRPVTNERQRQDTGQLGLWGPYPQLHTTATLAHGLHFRSAGSPPTAQPHSGSLTQRPGRWAPEGSCLRWPTCPGSNLWNLGECPPTTPTPYPAQCLLPQPSGITNPKT